jgi:hypothetical protein
LRIGDRRPVLPWGRHISEVELALFSSALPRMLQ